MSERNGSVPDWPVSFERPDPRACARLAELDATIEAPGDWSEELWRLVVEAGGVRWSLPPDQGGDGRGRAELLVNDARLAEASLTAAFILTQHDAAVRRLIVGQGAEAARWLRAVAEGRAFVTVGISQLTTSRKHGTQAVRATLERDGGVRLDGVMPWVTAAPRADALVTGGVLEDGRQVLVVLPTDRAGVTVQRPLPLAALQASCTSEVLCENVRLAPEEVLAGPLSSVMTIPGLASTGGLETSAVALGQARAALLALAAEQDRRDDLGETLDALGSAWLALANGLIAAAEERPDAPAPGALRGQCNAHVLRAAQAYLTARRGSGFLLTEPAQRWARQALFFLVWSCPTPVAQAALRDLAGLCPT